MSGALHQAFAAIAQNAANLSGVRNIPEKALVQKVAEKLGSTGIGLQKSPDTYSLNILAQELLETLWHQGTLSIKQLRNVAWCLWTTTPALAEDQDHLRSILDSISASIKKRPFRNLAANYLQQFDLERPGLPLISRVLQEQAIRWGEPWARLQREHNLYDHVNGPKTIARLALKLNLSPSETMKKIGIGALGSQSGFASAITKELLDELANGAELNHDVRLQKVQTYATHDGAKLIFQTLDREVAEALFKPFSDFTPAKDIKDKYLNFIISIFKDPRIDGAKWARFPAIREIVLRWLTEQSLRQFLDIVSKTVKDSSSAKMWKYRRAFWEAAHRKGIVQGAWVVFGEIGKREAKRAFGTNTSIASFVSGGSKPVQSSHAVLLLEIRGGIVSDWSHSGKVNVWTSSASRSAPKMYKSAYTSDDVRLMIGGSYDDYSSVDYLVKSHSSPETYNWQRVVAQRLYEITNIRMSEQDYKV